MPIDYDILALDLDGTLLRKDGSVSARNIAAVAEANDAGLEIVIATGRALVEAQHIIDEINHKGLFIGAGGAVLCDATTGETLKRSSMNPLLVKAIAASLINHGHLCHLLKDGGAVDYDYLIVGNGKLDSASEWWFNTFPVKVKHADSIDSDEHPEDTVRCGTVAAAGELKHIAEEIREDLGDSVFLQHWSAVTQTAMTGTGTHLLEAFSPEVNKWTMLTHIAEQRGIPLDRIAAIGDGLNDISMIREAGLGIAVGNADAGVIHVADKIVAENDENGVAQAIEAILSGSWRVRGGIGRGN